MKITDVLFENQDKEYAIFQCKLTPTIKLENCIGVRVPKVRLIAKEYIKDSEHILFLNELPHKYYDENMLHGLLISQIKDYKECIEELDKFLPYVDCWSICDIMSPKVLKKYKEDTLLNIKRWCKSKHTYTIRFAIQMLMSFYLDDDFKEEYLIIPSKIISDEYYVNMMVAWFFATALAKQYESTIKYIENNSLPIWVHNKTIQKALESYRINDTQKQYLRSLKRK